MMLCFGGMMGRSGECILACDGHSAGVWGLIFVFV